MTDQDQDYRPPAGDLTPVPVVLHSVAEGVSLSAPAAPRKYQCVAVPRTLVLTSDEPAQQLLRPDPDLDFAWVFCFTNNVVLSKSKGDAQASGNTAATITRPNGSLIPSGVMVPIETTSELWVSTGTYPTMVSVFPVYKR